MAKRTNATRAQPERIETLAEAIEFLGGNSRVAAWLDTTERHVATMKHRGRVPRGYLLHFYLTLQTWGADPAPAVFGLETFDHIVMAKPKATRSRSRGRRTVALAA